MSDKILSPEQVLALLAQAPERIAALTAGLADAQLRLSPGPGEWSANEVLAHLRSCADVWGGCMAQMLAQDGPTIRAVNPRSWIKSTDYLELGFHASLEAYTAQRAGLLALLEPLTPADWARTATITGAGAPLVRSVLIYGDWLAHHERPHLKQIARIVETVKGVSPTIAIR